MAGNHSYQALTIFLDLQDAGDGNDTISLPSLSSYSAGFDQVVSLGNYNPASSFLAGAGDDTITARDLDDIIEGGTGNDTFIFSLGTGNDTITDFEAGVAAGDVINLTAIGFANQDALEAAITYNGTDTVVDLGGGNSIHLLGVVETDLDLNSDFII